MDNKLIKPYEISVWEDRLIQNEDDYEFQEVKLAVIGSNTMTGLNKVYDPVFNKKSNGEKTLSFSLKYKYFDPYNGHETINPFVDLLVNERKVKLYYDNQWYEFIVKDHTEGSEDFTWTYTCSDAFVLELSKQGYNITFDSELNNNQGTARKLATDTLVNTNWKLGGTDNFKQKVAEPIYNAILHNAINVIDMDTGQELTIQPCDIYVFYSYIKNKNGKFVQFIYRYDQNHNYNIDDNNVITETNYRIITDLIFAEKDINGVHIIGFWDTNENLIIALNNIETQYQANRLVYNQLTTYDPIMERTVDVYTVEDGDRQIYKYTDYEYTTSDVVMNYITNGDNFNILEDGSLQGWNPYTDQEDEYVLVQNPSGNPKEKGWYELRNNTYVLTTDTTVITGKNYYIKQTKLVNKLELITHPKLGTNENLADIATLSQIEGYLTVKFNGAKTVVDGKVLNTIYNNGIESNSSFIKSISTGDKFVFRWRAGKGTPGSDNFVSTNKLGIIVAYYTQDAPSRFGFYYKHINPDDIILQIEGGEPQILNNIVRGGVLDNNGNYVIDGVIQVPSTKYVYEVQSGQEVESYVWDGTNSEFIRLEGSNYIPYYYLIGTATKSVSNTALKDVSTKIGVFIYTTENPGSVYIKTSDRTIDSEKTYYTRSGAGTDASPYIYTAVATPSVDNISTYYETDIAPIYIQDIQLTRFVPDNDNSTTPIIIGNVPTATSNYEEYYYVKPSDDAAAEDIVTYTDLNTLATDYQFGTIVPVYNEDCEKILSITASQSNCFNILQTIAETFECWIDLDVKHDSQGYILKDEDGQLQKYVYLREYAGKNNYAGFKYGINLQSIERTINSDEIVTKLIVDQTQSDYVDEGYISIMNAPSNQSGESYILNFNYYYNQGLLDRNAIEADRLQFIQDVATINAQLKEKEQLRRDLEASLVSIGSKRNTYTELIDSAQSMQTEELASFYELTGYTYEEYRNLHPTLEEDDRLTEEDTIFDVLGRIYTSSATINNYSGILTNIEQEYWNIRKQLKGSENYSVKIWVEYDDNQQRHVFVRLNDYLPNFSFTIGSITETSTPSKKDFDIQTNATELTLTAPTTPVVYGIPYGTPSRTVILDDNKVLTFKITCEQTIEGIEGQIAEIQQIKDDLTKAFNNKYSQYIQEGTWNSTDYIDAELYYLDALQVSNTSAQPTVSYTINVVEISELEGFNGYSFDAGDKTYVEDTEFFGWTIIDNTLTPAREEVIVSEVEWHLDSPEENVITVQNYKTRFEDLFQRISATIQTVQYNEATYAKTSSLLNADGSINQDVLLDSLNKISGQPHYLTSDGSIIIDGENIVIQNLTNSANRVIINSEGIRVSSDGGQTWSTAIDGQGINIGTVYTGTLNTNNVIIGNSENPSFRWDQSGISAYRQLPPTRATTGQAYDLKTYVRYDQYGLYGIKDNEHFKAQSLQDVLDRAHFAVTWDGFFIKNSYAGGGRVEITTDNDFRVLNDPSEQGNFQEKIKIGALEWGSGITSPTEQGATALPTLYGIRIKNDNQQTVMQTDDEGNITITGIINAIGGNFSDLVTVGKDDNDNSKPYIEIDGRDNQDATIRSSRYSQDGASYGWMINADGDAVFNNITARGAIKTAVFEYAEIQAVGGIFIFRPASTIRNAEREGVNDVKLTLEKPYLFKVGDWCKVSNYTDEMNEPRADGILENNGLTHVYKIKSINSENTRIIVLENAYAALTSGNTKVINNITDLIGGSLIDMGDKANGDGQVGNSNYGIGINSSDNVVDLPRRAISLFETIVDETENPKVSYRYRGILGTLPMMHSGVNQNVYRYMQNTQGIYTDNMYIGDDKQYIAFYTDTSDNKKKLKISAKEIVYEINESTGEETTWEEHIDEQIPIVVKITSSAGEMFIREDIYTILTCTVFKGNVDITNQVTRFTWTKYDKDGIQDETWVAPIPSGRTITIGPADVASKAIFKCEVEF